MSAPNHSLAPTLARLSFWVPPARSSEFEVIYQNRLVPILKGQGLVEFSEQGRPTVAGVFSRLFAVESPAAVVEKAQALQEDAGYQEVVQEVRQAIALDPYWQQIRTQLASPTAEREFLTGRFDLYSAPAGPGKQTIAGPGKQQVAGRGSGRWRTFDATDGLRGGYIRSILQDAEGALWIGSQGGGLSRYDGHQFKTFAARDGLTSQAVQSVVLAQDGALWIGTHGQGIYRYDGQRFAQFTTAEGLVDNYVLRLFQDREGNLWIGTWKGLSRWDGHTFTSFTAQDRLPVGEVHAIFQDREGHLWFGFGALAGGSPGGACRYDGRTFTPFTAADGLEAKNGVWAIAQDHEGSLWFGTAGGVSRYDQRGFKTFTTADGLGADEVWAILQDREGALWFGTKYGGVSRYDGQRFTTLTTEDGLGSNSLEAIFEDREGALWFGTWSGLSRYETHTLTTFTAQDGLPDDQVLSVCQDREGALWFGTAEAGICRYDGQTFTTFSTEDGLPDDRVSLLFQDREGLLWFSTTTQSSGKGVCRYDGQTFTTFTAEDGLADDRVYAIFQDREGAFWFGTSRYDGQVFASSPLAGGLPSSMWISYSMWISAIAQDQEGVLWFSTQGRGVIRYDGQEFSTFTTQDGLANNVVHSMAQDRDRVLWFGTHGGGVSRYDGRQFKTFTAQDGLADDVVRSLIQDRQGRIWIGTPSGGVSCFDGQVFQTLTAQDGLASNETTAIFEDRDGDFWFCTSGGVTRYHPPAPSSPPIFIDAVVADRRYERRVEVEVPVGARLIAFEFHGISFKTRPEAMVYRYRLGGHDEAWCHTHARRVEYQDLSPGAYCFQVQAVDRDLAYSELAQVRLVVIPDPRIAALTEVLQVGGTQGDFVGNSPYLHLLLAQVEEVARTELSALVQGETGTGKGLVARAIHTLSGRKKGPFIQVNCGALAEGLVESELFGHERGAFTGATSRKLGRVELAESGTLFLDEIGDLPLAAQVKILRVLEERVFERVGGEKTLRANIRVVAATNRDLEQMVVAGTFREDLYYRLRVYPIEVPSLRERQEDIPMLATYFLARMAAHLNKKVQPLTPEVERALQAYAWPGNVRELEHVIQRAVIVCKGERIQVGDLEVVDRSGKGVEEIVSLEEHERRYIREVLARTGWRIRGAQGAAALLGIHEATLRTRMKKLGIIRGDA